MTSVEVMGINFSLGNRLKEVKDKVDTVVTKAGMDAVAIQVKAYTGSENYNETFTIEMYVNTSLFLTLKLYRGHKLIREDAANLNMPLNEMYLAYIELDVYAWMIGVREILRINKQDMVDKLNGKRSAADINRETWRLVTNIKCLDCRVLTSQKLYHKMISECRGNYSVSGFRMDYNVHQRSEVSGWDCILHVSADLHSKGYEKVRRLKIEPIHVVKRFDGIMAYGSLVN